MLRFLAGIFAALLFCAPVGSLAQPLLLGVGSASGGGPPPGGLTFRSGSTTVVSFPTNGVNVVNFTPGSAANADLMVCTSINNGPLTSLTLPGSGAMTLVNTTGDANGISNSLWSAILNSTDISTHTITTDGNAITDYGIVCLIYSGAGSVIYRDFDFQAVGVSTVTFSATWTPDPSSKGLGIIAIDSNFDALTPAISPGSWALRFSSTNINPDGYFQAVGGWDLAGAATNVTRNLTGFATSGGHRAFLYEFAP